MVTNSIFNPLNSDISTSTTSLIFILLFVLFAVRYYRYSVKRIVSLTLLSMITLWCRAGDKFQKYIIF